MWGAAGTAARAGMVIADVQYDEFLSKRVGPYHFPAEFLLLAYDAQNKMIQSLKCRVASTTQQKRGEVAHESRTNVWPRHLQFH